MFTAKDKALIEASRLIGYCRSASSIKNQEVTQAWLDGLLEAAECCGNAIDKALEEGK